MKEKRVKSHHSSRAITICSLLKLKNTLLFKIKSCYFT
jgi:hypothetical protein